jgi:DNA polymerase I-like protein with 3'-5' exonuclease and polymerase domains
MAKYDGGAYADVVLNQDIHTFNMEMAGLETRDQAKGFIYALLYGAGDAKLGEQMGGVSAYKAKKARQTMLTTLPALQRVIDDVQAAAENHGHVQLLDGQMSCPPEQAEELCRLTEQASIDAGKMFNTQIPTESEAKIGANWWECH